MKTDLKQLNLYSINHIFMGHSWLLVSQMIEKIVKFSKHNHHFIVIIDDSEQETLYLDLFRRLSYSNFEFWYNYNKKTRICAKFSMYIDYIHLLLSGIWIRHKSLQRYLFVLKKVRKFSQMNVIIHSELNDICLFFLTKRANVYWCCWGGVPIKHKFRIYELFKKRYYGQIFLNKCAAIITLTNSDCDAFKKLCPNTEVYQVSYSYIYNFDDICYKNKSSKKILVGNSSSYIADYSRVVEFIKDTNGGDITFMCSYGIDLYSDQYITWKTTTNMLLSNHHVHYWEKNLCIKDYNKEIASYKVYIAPMSRQSGLGAITTALGAGVKCYLSGVNYDYFAQKGLIIYKVENLEKSTLEEIVHWENKNAQTNIKLVREVCGGNQSLLEWESIYSKIAENE